MDGSEVSEEKVLEEQPELEENEMLASEACECISEWVADDFDAGDPDDSDAYELLEEYTYDSMFGPAEVFTMETDEGEALRVLYVGGGFQSATYLGPRRFEAPFAYCHAFNVLFQRKPAPRKVLLVGGGAYSFPKDALMTRDDFSMDVVEIDPVVIDIARKHFFVDELEERCADRLRSIAQDGMDFLRTADEASYDALVNDSFAGTALDTPLLSAEGLRLSKRALAPDGLYLLNAATDDEGEIEGAAETMRQVECALTGAFANVWSFVVEDEEFGGCTNRIFVASDAPLPDFDLSLL